MNTPVNRTILAAASILLLGSALVPAAHAGSGTSRDSVITESKRTKDGELRCTVTFPSATLHPGEETGGHMKVTNTTDHDVTFYLGFRAASIVVRDDNGTTLVNTADWPLPSPAPDPVTCRRISVAQWGWATRSSGGPARWPSPRSATSDGGTRSI